MSAITSLIIKNDILCFYALNRRIHCSLLNVFMKNMTELGSTGFAVGAALFFLFYNKYIGFILVINLIASQAIIQLLKRLVNRPRPYKTLEWAIAIKPPKCKYSLPSGHSSSALSIALVLSYFFPALKPAFIAVALIVGISRIYLGCHYPTDVSIGFFISFAVFKALQTMTIF